MSEVAFKGLAGWEVGGGSASTWRTRAGVLAKRGQAERQHQHGCKKISGCSFNGFYWSLPYLLSVIGLLA